MEIKRGQVSGRWQAMTKVIFCETVLELLAALMRWCVCDGKRRESEHPKRKETAPPGAHCGGAAGREP